jgi:hypothetical protein
LYAFTFFRYAAGRRLVREAVFLDAKEGDKYVYLLCTYIFFESSIFTKKSFTIQIYLFSDILVWGKPTKRLLGGTSSLVKYKDTIPLDTITVTGIITIRLFTYYFTILHSLLFFPLFFFTFFFCLTTTRY